VLRDLPNPTREIRDEDWRVGSSIFREGVERPTPVAFGVLHDIATTG
jgi:hypothetical protein